MQRDSNIWYGYGNNDWYIKFGGIEMKIITIDKDVRSGCVSILTNMIIEGI